MELDQVFHCHVTRDYQRASGKRWGIVRLAWWNGVEMNLKNRWLGMQDAGVYSRNGHIVSFLSTSIIMVIDLVQKSCESAVKCSVSAWVSSIVYPNHEIRKRKTQMDSHFWVAGIPWNSHSLGPKTTFGFWPRLDTPPDLWRIHRRPWKCWMPCKSQSWAWALVAWRPALVRLKQVAARTTQTTYHGSWVLFCWLIFQGNHLFKTIILDLTSLTWLFLTWLDLMIDLFGLRTCELRSWGSKSRWTGAGAQLSRQIDCQVLGVITNQEIEWHRSILTWPWSYSNIFLSVEFYPPLDFLKTDQAPCLALEASPSSSSQLLPCCLSVWLLRWLAGPLGGGPAPARARRRVPRERGPAQKERLVIPEIRQRNCGSCWRRERIWWEYGKHMENMWETCGKHVSLWLMVLTFWMVMSFEYWETCVLVWWFDENDVWFPSCCILFSLSGLMISNRHIFPVVWSKCGHLLVIFHPYFGMMTPKWCIFAYFCNFKSPGTSLWCPAATMDSLPSWSSARDFSWPLWQDLASARCMDLLIASWFLTRRCWKARFESVDSSQWKTLVWWFFLGEFRGSWGDGLQLNGICWTPL